MNHINVFFVNLVRWVDSEAGLERVNDHGREFNWLRCFPFIALHLACLGVIWTGISLFAALFALGFYLIRMFAITGFYHRYFSHRSFKTNRFWQFMFALLGCSAVQRGPLWWAAHHRHHHQHSDSDDDLHSPNHGFWWSHIGWFTCDAGFKTRYERVRDLARFPELRFINRFDILVPFVVAVLIYGLGELLAAYQPGLNTNGPQLLVVGFFISTVVLFHATFTINSLCHVWGKRRFQTEDDSRNNFWLALLTLGEGWHNNHHRWPTAARQGFYWWEIDLTYYGLKLLSWLGIIHDLRPVPPHVLAEAHTTPMQKETPA